VFIGFKMDKSFGILFKNIRNNNLYSQAYVAKKLNVSQSYISQIEKGDREPSLDFIENAYQKLGFELIIIDIEQEKELLFKMLNKLKPYNIKKIVNYAQRLCKE
jgi:transcriptional regulator with XRE-family HTH domain